MSSRSDDFNRADSASSLGTPSDAGSAWSAFVGTWGIASNKGYLATAGGDIQNTAALDSGSSDCDVQAVLTWTTADAGLIGRAADATNYLLMVVRDSGTTVELYKRVAGSFTSLGTYAGAVASGDTFKLSMSGGTVNCYQNGTARVGPVTESAGSTNTKHGLRYFAGLNVRFDDFSVVDAGGGGGVLYTQLERGTRGEMRGTYAGRGV